MNLEREPQTKNHNKRRLAPLAGMLTVAIGITGCGGGSSTSKNEGASKVVVTTPTTSRTNETSTTSTTALTPNSNPSTTNPQPTEQGQGNTMKPSLAGGYCVATAQIACHMGIFEGYQAATQANNILVNQTAPPSPNAYQISWPEATLGGHRGDAVAVECYVTDGDYTAPPLGGKGSSDWYEIAVPVSKISNHYVLSELEHPGSTQTPPIKSFDYNGVPSVNGWDPIVYFNQLTPSPNVPQCK